MADKDGMSIINSHIEKGSFASVYLLCGDEKYLMHQYKNKLIDALCDRTDTMNFVTYKGDSIKADAISEFAHTMPFFADRRVVLVESSDYFKRGNEEIEKLISDIPDTTVIIFAEDNVDGKLKLCNRVKEHGVIAKFSTPDDETLRRWIGGLFARDNIQVEKAAVYRLVDSVGIDMLSLSNEVEKLKSYCIEKGEVTVSDVEALCIDQIEDKIFVMMDALSNGDKKKTLEIYDDLLSLREPAMKLLSLISRQFNILLKVRFCLDRNANNEEIASVAKIKPFAVKKNISQAKGYTYEQLLNCVNLCQETDTNIKTGIMTDKVAVELLIMNLLHKKAD